MWWPFRNKPNAPTPHHYVLAHVALRQACFEDPMHFLGVMASEEREDFLAWVWEQVRESCDGEGRASFAISDLKVATVRCGGHPTLLVRMPPPRELSEAHMIGVVLELPERGQGYDAVHYFTLERARGADGAARAQLCAWSAAGERATHDVNLSVDERAFLSAMAAVLYDAPPSEEEE